MDYIVHFVFWLIGIFVTNFTLLPILIILIFGIPTTKKFEREGRLIKNNGIIKGYLLSLVLLGTIFTVIYWVIQTFFPVGITGFLVATGMVLLFSLGKAGNNQNNMSDYLQTNASKFTKL